MTTSAGSSAGFSSNMLTRVAQLYDEIADSAPLFAPHASAVFKRKESLGEGGMGVVYRVEDERLGREAALKVMRLTETSDKLARRFLREVKVTASLDHPCIPPVYEAGMDSEGRYYMLMRVIEGRTLKDCVLGDGTQSQLAESTDSKSERELLEALANVADAVAHAHSRGIVHRDLKPSNIMIGRFGETMVMDWGVSRISTQAESESDHEWIRQRDISVTAAELEEAGLSQGMVLGTFGFMPPEQAKGEKVDAKADVFALGALLSFILTSKAPIEGDRQVVRLVNTLEGRIILPKQRRRSVPSALNFIAAQALQAKHAERTSSATVFARQLRAYLAGENVPGYRYPPWEWLALKIRQRPALLVLFLAGLLIISLFNTVRVQKNLASLAAQEAQRQAAAAKDEQEVAKQTAERGRLILKSLTRAKSLARSGQSLAEVRELLAKALGQEQDSLALLLSAAQVYIDIGDLPQARSLLDKALEDFPPAYQASFMLHELQLDEQKSEPFTITEPLRALVKEAQSRGDSNEFTELFRAFELSQKKRYQEAIAIYDEIEKRQPGLIWVYLNRAHVYGVLNSNEKAYEDADKALRIDSQQPKTYAVRGLYALRIGRSREAFLDSNYAIQKGLKNSNTYRIRGLSYWDLGDTKAALKDLEKALSYGHDKVRVTLSIIGILQEMGRHAEGLKRLEGIYQLEPENASIYVARANLYWEMGRSQDALKEYNQAIVRKANWPGIYYGRGRVYYSLGDMERAYSDLRRAVNWSADNVPAMILFSRVALNLKRTQEAYKAVQAAIKWEPLNPELYMIRSRILFAMGRERDTFLDLDTLLQRRPSYHPAYLLRAQFLFRKKRFKRARNDLDKALLLAPEEPEYYDWRGRARRALKDYRGALEDLRQCLRLIGKEPGAKAIRERINQIEIERLEQE